jgi:hypothetical protein
MATHGYYSTPHRRSLRQAALARDGYRRTVTGCSLRVTHVDHIVTRPRSPEPAPEDRLDNLRSLCATHDVQTKEQHSGRRGHGGHPVVKGCDAGGWPFSGRGG